VPFVKFDLGDRAVIHFAKVRRERDRRREGKTADGRQLKTADSRRQVAEGRGSGSSALSRLPTAVYRLQFSAVFVTNRPVLRPKSPVPNLKVRVVPPR